jgi:tetratricopeptide (TPR) repeat protein
VERATPIESRAAVDAYGESAARLMELALRQGQRGRWYVRAARLNLADIAVIRGEWSEAAAQTRALLDETASTLGQCHSVRSAAMIMLAQAESRLGRPGEAAELYLRAIDCTRGATGSEILLLVHLSDALPALDRAQRWSDGERCVREILDQIQRMGPGHIGAMRYQAYLAHFISRQGRIDEAQSMFDALLAQPPDEAAAAPRLSLAYADHLIRLGRFEEAEHKLHELAGSPVAAPYFPEEYPGKLLMLYRAWGQDDKVVELQRQHDEIIRMAATQAITAQ